MPFAVLEARNLLPKLNVNRGGPEHGIPREQRDRSEIVSSGCRRTLNNELRHGKRGDPTPLHRNSIPVHVLEACWWTFSIVLSVGL